MTTLVGNQNDIKLLQVMRHGARGKDQKAFDDLTYLLGEIDRKRGGKKFSVETVALETTVSLVALFNNAAEDPMIQNNLDLISQHKSTANFYGKLLPVAMTKVEINDTFRDAVLSGCQNVKSFITFFDANWFGRYERATLIAKVQAWQGEGA